MENKKYNDKFNQEIYTNQIRPTEITLQQYSSFINWVECALSLNNEISEIDRAKYEISKYQVKAIPPVLEYMYSFIDESKE